MTPPSAAPEPEQLFLFRLGDDMRQLRQRAAELQRLTHAPTTKRAYQSDSQIFARWCRKNGRKSAPASAETIALFAAAQLESLSTATVNRRITAIRADHAEKGLPPPPLDEARAVIRGARREKGSISKAKSALTVEELRRISAEFLQKGTPIATRDRALLVFGFASGMRRGELSALDLRDVTTTTQGLSVTIRRSKTDAYHAGRTIGLFRGGRRETCPVRALAAWLRIRGTTPGPLFCQFDPRSARPREPLSRLSGESIGDTVQRAAAMIGLDPRRYGGHSLRAGMVTAALQHGASESLVMRRTGHRSRETMDRYVRPATEFSADPLAKAL
jgi:integrase